MSDFNGKVVIVTGAAGGIGRATAIQFAQQGAKVAVADIDEQRVNETAAMIGDNALALTVNVASADSCQAMVANTVAKFGRLDIIFNNAGISGERAYTANQTLEAWHKVIDINLNGVFYCTKFALPEMLKVGSGVIVNTASIDGQIGMATIPHYCASKHAVIGLTKSCAIEYGPQNIRCVAIAPGYVNTHLTQSAFNETEAAIMTSMIPQRRAAEPDEVANLVLWLASDKASYVTGSTHTIDGGITAGFGDMRSA
ncbi:SDR family NAD(P)-dependent oxidoreductase [Oceanicoccus sp. KOV_DT_Chl]|uniref:SDR family NAD(P)-dependent oxidoreductase n=1 Tax=Oceanicoccus sp. KOV_DT_Chl TaxID=1904639 RepID=UPI000C79816F|nr:glucose 1-dehydrogenase [Oceanicoccus sp. KOV_DT_Chl]